MELVDEQTAKVKRGGRLVLVTDREIAKHEYRTTALAVNLLTGKYADQGAMKVSQPQGLPVRRSYDVTCPIYVSPYHQVLSVDGLLELAQLTGLSGRTGKVGQTSPRIDVSQTALVDAAGNVVSRSTMPTRQDLVERFTAGVEDGPPPVDLAIVAKNCRMLADGLANGGDGDPEPFWRLKVILAVFSTDPRGNAHLLGEGDGRYTIEKTDKKLALVERQQVERGFGWPDCTSFAHFSQRCASCAHLDKKKSPLHLGLGAAAALTVDPLSGVAVSGTVKEDAARLFDETKRTLKSFRSHRLGLAKTVQLLLSTDAAAARSAFIRVGYLLLGRTEIRDTREVTQIMVSVGDRLFGDGQGGGMVAKIIRGLNKNRARDE